MAHARRILCFITDGGVRAVGCDPAGAVRFDRVLPCAVPGCVFDLADARPLAEAVAEACRSAGPTDRPITLVIPLRWVFVHPLPAPRCRREESLRFALEEFLPVPLEEVTCAFPATGRGVLGVAVPTAALRHLLETLEALGTEVCEVLVDALAIALDKGAEPDQVMTLIRGTRCTHVIGRAAAAGAAGPVLACLPASLSPAQSIQELQMRGIDAAADPGAWRVLEASPVAPDDSPPDANSGRSAGAASIRHDTQKDDPLVRAVLAAPPEADLRVHALAGEGRLRAVERRAEHGLVALVLLLLVVHAGLGLHSRTLRRHIAAVHAARQEVYNQVFPGSPVPAGASLRLASQRKRLESLTLRGAAVPDETCGLALLETLRDVVAGLPEDVRVRLLSASLDDHQVSLRGQTAEHRDAERIAEAVGAVAGLDARPPRTTRLDAGGVEFSILAAAKETKEAAP